MILNKNIKIIVCSPDGDTNFDIVTSVLQGDIVALYLFIFCLQISIDQLKENSPTLKKARNR